MATNRPTTRELADSILSIQQQTELIVNEIRAIHAVQQDAAVENDKMWTALRGVAGLDGLSTGVSEVEEAMSSSASEIRKGMLRSARRIRRGMAEGAADIQAVLAPLRSLVPPSTALPLEPGVAGALQEIRQALGGRRDTNFPGMTTDWDGPVEFIGQADPSLDATDSSGRPWVVVGDDSYDNDTYPDSDDSYGVTDDALQGDEYTDDDEYTDTDEEQQP